MGDRGAARLKGVELECMVHREAPRILTTTPGVHVLDHRAVVVVSVVPVVVVEAGLAPVPVDEELGLLLGWGGRSLALSGSLAFSGSLGGSLALGSSRRCFCKREGG